MNVVVSMILIVTAFTVGLVAGAALSQSVIEDLRNLLAHLLEKPNDPAIRAIVRATLYQEQNNG